jgi:hypothetical protein
MVYRPKFQVPTRQSLGLTTHVDYSKYDPNHGDSTHGRKSLTNLDYSPLRRVTLASFFMAILVSMGGFIFGYDTGMHPCQPSRSCTR